MQGQLSSQITNHNSGVELDACSNTLVHLYDSSQSTSTVIATAEQHSGSRFGRIYYLDIFSRFCYIHRRLPHRADFTPPPGGMWKFVSLSVRLSALIGQLKAELHKIFTTGYLWLWLCPLLTALQYYLIFWFLKDSYSKTRQTSLLVYAIRSEYRLLPVSIVEQNLVGISALMILVFCRRLWIHTMRHRAIMWKHDVIHKTGST